MRLKHFFVVALLLITGVASAQQMPTIPVDTAVRIGKLSNGLTYYIRHNNYPEGVANFYIAQKVGSLQENEDQRGLAHLLEHMAFNGSEHFKDNGLQEYLQSIGVEYGRNLNAYTSIDQTVYYITDVPTKRISALDSCMLVLKDWSNGLTLDTKAINDERDIIHNEYRMRVVGQQKVLEKILPDIYPGSKYGQRFPIGLMSVIDGCNPETLRAYYHKWYRPDNQGIIIVGDIDVNRTEAKIKELFSGIKVPDNAAKVTTEPVPDNNTAIYTTGSDKEVTVDLLSAYMKHDAVPDSLKSSMFYLIGNYGKGVISQMLNQRLTEKAQEKDAPFVQAMVSDGQYIFARTKDAFSLVVVPKDGQDKEGLAAGLSELKRAHDYGFTATEYDRARSEYLSRLETIYNNRNKQPSDDYCEQYVRNFIESEPIPSITDEYELTKQFAPSVPLQLINQLTRQLISPSDTNLVVVGMLQDKVGHQGITTAEMKQTVADVRAKKLEAYVDNVKQEPLMTQMPKKGRIVKETEIAALGVKKLTLSNGATVYLKKTDFNADEIMMKAEAQGGESVFGESDRCNAIMAEQLLNQSGLGNFSNTELQKQLAGKQCNTSFSIENSRHSISGKTTPKDLETLMQLTYLDFTNVSKDEKAAQSELDMMALALKNVSQNNDAVFQDSIASTLYKGSRWFRIPTEADVKAVSYDRVLEMGKQLYANAANFTFTFAGNFDEAQMRQFIEQYIASLPSTGKPLKTRELRTFATGEVKNDFKKEMQNPQTQVNEIWRSNSVPYTLQNAVLMEASQRLLEMNYNREIREKLSAAYHAGADFEIEDDGQDTYLIMKGIGLLNPDKAATAVPYFFSGMKATIAQPDEVDLAKVKQIMLKQADEDAKTNDTWIYVINTYSRHNVDVETDLKKTIEAVTPAAVSKFLQDVILKSGNHIEVMMQPK
jgi:zinc protease